MDRAGKIALLTGGRDIARCPGIEIGPRDAPLIAKHDGPILYADYADADTIRANLHNESIDPAAVVTVDIVTGGGSMAAIAPRQVDYIVASHVAEHVPDLLGWLVDLHAVLTEGGTVGLAIPDRRFTFDRFRRESTIAEAVEAYLLRATRPSLRQIFDSAWQAIEIGVDQAWRNEIPLAGGAAQRLDRLLPALDLVRAVHDSGRYNDAHCWVFTPASFLDMLEQAARMRLLPFTLHRFYSTPFQGYEFYAVLRRADGDHGHETLASILAARAMLSDNHAEKAYNTAHNPIGVEQLRAENAKLKNMLQTMQDSTIWRATSPIRNIVGRLRG